MLAGIVAAIAFAAPALGGAGERHRAGGGDGATLVPETPLTTDDARRSCATGDDACSGTSALGALHAATGGDWSGTWFDGARTGSSRRSRARRTLVPATRSTGRSGSTRRTRARACATTELQDGRRRPASAARRDDGPDPRAQPACPATVAAGQAVTVTVHEHGVRRTTRTPPYDLIRTDGPRGGRDGAAPAARPRRSAPTARRGSPSPPPAPSTVAGHASRGTSARAVRARRRSPRRRGPATRRRPPARPPQDTTAPDRGLLLGARRRQGVLPPQGAARAERHGLGRPVRAALRPPLDPAARTGGKCWTYRDTTERFKRHECGGKWYFRIGDRAEWSYLLPRKLPKGRYTIGVMAVDKAFNESRTTVEDPRPVRRALLPLARGRPRRRARRGARGGRAHRAGDGRRQVVRARRSAEGQAGRRARWRSRGKRCATGARTALSALAATKLPLTFKDYGACSRRPAESGSLYVRSIAGERASGADGWVYKVGRRVGTTGAADPSGAFGDGRRLRTGQKVLWFWCVKDAADACQRTLEVAAPRTVAPGAAFHGHRPRLRRERRRRARRRRRGRAGRRDRRRRRRHGHRARGGGHAHAVGRGGRAWSRRSRAR